jgi:hypothetical protein
MDMPQLKIILKKMHDESWMFFGEVRGTPDTGLKRSTLPALLAAPKQCERETILDTLHPSSNARQLLEIQTNSPFLRMRQP